MLKQLCGGLLAIALMTSGTHADDMPAWLKYAAPGKHHKHIDAMAGSWDATSRFWMKPGEAPAESKATSENTWILGGTFLQQDYKGDWGGQVFTGRGMTGYDNFTREYISTWCDSMSSTLSKFVGTCSHNGRVMTSFGSGISPVDGKMHHMKNVVRILSPNKHTFEMWDRVGRGEWNKTMEIVYTRRH